MITVTKSIHIEGTDDLDEVGVTGISYASVESNALIESVRTFGGDHYLRRSEDNGKTWQRTEEWLASKPIAEDLELERDLPDFYLDPNNGWMYRHYHEAQTIPSMIGWDEDQPTMATRRVFIQISKDEGRSWSEPKQLIMAGDEYDAEHWARGVRYGKNSLAIEGANTMTGPDGTIMMPFWLVRLFDNGTMRSPDDGLTETLSGLYMGRWREDGSGIDWDMSGFITLARKYSADGADEPSVDWLPDGRMLCILRTRNLDHPQMEIPSSKCYSISEDNGWTWSPGEPLLYDDGGYVLSPASLGNVFRSSKNGRFYAITNFIDEPTYNCDPRTKLQIAELDTTTLRVIRDSVTVIDEREGDEPEYIRFSNFRWYEDRETQDIALYMAHNAGDTGRSVGCGLDPHNYRYDIRLPKE